MSRAETVRAERAAMVEELRRKHQEWEELARLRLERLPTADSNLLSEDDRWRGSSLALKVPLADGLLAIYLPDQTLRAEEVEMVEKLMALTVDAYRERDDEMMMEVVL